MTVQYPEDLADYADFAPFYGVLFTDSDDDVQFWEGVAEGATDVCEIGCGNGRLSEILARTVPNVVGVDPSPAMLKLVGDSPLARYETGSLAGTTLKDASFDLVICPRGAVSHVISPDGMTAAARELFRLTKPGGRVVVDVPRYSGDRSTRGKFKRLLKKRRGDVVYDIRSRVETDRVWGYLETTYQVTARRGRAITGMHEVALRTRILTLQELVGWMAAAGFKIENAYGDYDRSTVTADAGRLILVGRRPIS